MTGASTALDELAGLFSIKGHAESYRADVPASWDLVDRTFGGYSAALTVAAAAVDVAAPARLASAKVLFLEPVVAGEAQLEVTTIRSGRSLSWRRSTLRQGGRNAVTCFVGLRVPPPTERVPCSGQPAQAVPPANLKRIEFLSERYPYARNFDERAVDYPDTHDGFGDGSFEVAVWAQATASPFDGTGIAAQLFDLALADAHLLDAVCRGAGVRLDDAFSIDLDVVWVEGAPDSEWRRVDVDGAKGSDFAPCRAVVTAADGSTRAYAQQAGRIYLPR